MATTTDYARFVRPGMRIVLPNSGSEVIVERVKERRAYGKIMVDMKGRYSDGRTWMNSYPAVKRVTLVAQEAEVTPHTMLKIAYGRKGGS